MRRCLVHSGYLSRNFFSPISLVIFHGNCEFLSQSVLSKFNNCLSLSPLLERQVSIFFPGLIHQLVLALKNTGIAAFPLSALSSKTVLYVK